MQLSKVQHRIYCWSSTKISQSSRLSTWQSAVLGAFSAFHRNAWCLRKKTNGCNISFDFTQEETLKLGSLMSVQVRARKDAKNPLSETVASEIVTAPVTDVLLKQVI